MEKISVIGLGEIGSTIFEDIYKTIKQKNLNYSMDGVDINKELLERMRKTYAGSNFSETIGLADIYIISVYTVDQAIDVIRSLKFDKGKKPLLIIESTISLKFARLLRDKFNKKFDIVLFPHRFNPNDPEHRVFNLNRIIGAIDDQSLNRALDLYKQFMPLEKIFKFPYEIVAISKIAENSYRFMEIAIAEDFKLECDRNGLDFDELRNAMNTKWNIDVREAKDGIGGKCLPKDIGILGSLFKKSKMIKTAIKVNEDYKKVKSSKI